MLLTREEQQLILQHRAEQARPKLPPRLFVIPVRLVSEANYHEHWRVRYQRKLAQQLAVKIAFHNAAQQEKIRRPRVVIMRRIGMKKLDSDNLAGSCKHLQDAIAKLLKIDDGDEAITWRYEQRATGKRNNYAVEVEFHY